MQVVRVARYSFTQLPKRVSSASSASLDGTVHAPRKSCERARERDRHRTRSELGTLSVRVNCRPKGGTRRDIMNGLIYLVGLIVVIMAVLSFFGLR